MENIFKNIARNYRNEFAIGFIKSCAFVALDSNDLLYSQKKLKDILEVIDMLEKLNKEKEYE